MALVGLDIERIRALAQLLHQAGQALGDTEQRLRVELNSLAWTGTAAQEFESQLVADLAALRRISESLDLLARIAITNADAQESVSMSLGDNPNRPTPKR